MENNECCFSKILSLIDKLQRNSESHECFDNSCTRPYLGVNVPYLCFNTRPITLYNCNNELININYQYNQDGTIVTGTTNTFRVEKINGCCVTVSLLIPNTDTTDSLRPYISINQTAVINLNCVCAIKCLGDCIVDL